MRKAKPKYRQLTVVNSKKEQEKREKKINK